MAASPEVLLQQAVLKAAGVDIKVDGVLGPRTRSALKTNPQLAQTVSKGVAIASEAAFIGAANDDWITEAEADKYIAEASAITGIDRDTLKWMLNQEARKETRNGRLSYNVRSQNGRHLGLGQHEAKAWTDARRWAMSHAGAIKLSPFSIGWSDPRQSIHAMAYYSKQQEVYVADLVRRYKMPPITLSDRNLRYSVYNQGHGFVLDAYRNTFSVEGKQSNAAKSVHAAAQRMVQNA